MMRQRSISILLIIGLLFQLVCPLTTYAEVELIEGDPNIVAGDDAEPVVDPQEEAVVGPQEEPLVGPQEEAIVDPQEEALVDPQEEPLVDLQEEPIVDLQEEPIVDPQEEPIVDPQEEPLVDPQEEAIVDPQEEPLVDLQEEPVVDPQEEPIVDPQEEPIVDPQEEPIVDPQEEPIVDPQEEPIVDPQEEPLVDPQEEPIVDPQEEPIVDPQEEALVDPQEEAIIDPQDEAIIDPQEEAIVDPQEEIGVEKLELETSVSEEIVEESSATLDFSTIKSDVKTYFDNQAKWDYLTTIAYRHCFESTLLDDLKGHSKLYSPKGLYNAYKGIIRTVALDLDPRNAPSSDETTDYVTILEEGQSQSNGSFNSNIQTHVECLQAAKMAQATFDSEKAIAFLVSKLAVDGDRAAVTKWNGDTDPRPTALVLLGLSLYPSENESSIHIPKCVNALKALQNEDGTFEGVTTGKDLALIARALTVAGEDILSSSYIKNNKSMLDALLAYQLEDKTFRSTTYDWDDETDESMMAEMLALLAELNQPTSMFIKYKAEVGMVVSKISLVADESELLVGEETKVTFRGLDDVGLTVPTALVTWSSDDDTVVTVTDGVVSAVGPGTTNVIATDSMDTNIQAEIEMTVVEAVPTKLEVYRDNKVIDGEVQLLVDESFTFTTKVYNQKDQLMTNVEATVSISSGDEFIDLSDLTLSAVSPGKSVVSIQVAEQTVLVNVSVNSVSDLVSGLLTKHLDDVSSNLSLIEVLALKQAGKSNSEIIPNINIESDNRAATLAENIIKLYVVGLDPRNYDNENLVEKLKDSQGTNGYFSIGYKTEIVDIALPIIALEMLGESYDKENAYSILHIKAKSYGMTRVCDSDSSRSKVENTAYAIIALSFNQADGDDKSLMMKMIAYLKEKQTDKGTLQSAKYYRNYHDAKATAWGILAIQAAGQNPLSTDWIKDGVSFYDGLVEFEVNNGFSKYDTGSSKDTNATAACIGALSAIAKGVSPFYEFKEELGEIPATISILNTDVAINEKESIKFICKVVDENGKRVINQKINWTISDNTVGTIDSSGLLVLENIQGDQSINVVATVSGTEIKASHTLNIIDRIPSSIEVSKSTGFVNVLKSNGTAKLSAKIKDQNGKVIDYLSFTWSSDHENILSVDADGNLVAVEVSEENVVAITATCDEIPTVKQVINVRVIPIIPKKVTILRNDEIVTELALESGFKADLSAKAFEEDDTLISDSQFTWSSSDEAVATVDENGIVTVKNVTENTSVNITAKVKNHELSKGITINVLPRVSIDSKVVKELDSYKDFYKSMSTLKDFDILVAACAKQIGSLEESKLDIQTVNYKSGYSGDEPKEYGQRIISLVASGNDPFDDEGHDTVGFLIKSQNSNGVFETSSSYNSDDIDDFAYAMLALDILGETYEVNKSVEAIIDDFTVSGDKAYVRYSYGMDDEYFRTGLPLIALSYHQEISGVSEIIEKGYNYLVSEFHEKDLDADAIAQILIVMKAIGKDYSDLSKNDSSGNALNIVEWMINEETKSSYVLGALLCTQADKPLHNMIGMSVGDPSNVTLNLESEDVTMKIGSTKQLSVIVTDADGKKIRDAEYTLSIDKENVVSLDSDSLLLEAMAVGLVNVTVEVKDFSSVKKTYCIHVIKPKVERVELNPVENKTELKVGEKLKFNPEAFDLDDDVIGGYEWEWIITPENAGHMIDDHTFIAESVGDAQVKFIASNEDGSKIPKAFDIAVVASFTDKEKAVSAINSTFQYVKNKSTFDYAKSLALRSAGVVSSDIQEKINIYGYDGVHNTSRNVINLIAANLNPQSYKEKNHLEKINELEIDGWGDKRYLPKLLIALDMSNSKKDRSQIIDALVANLKSDDNKKYFEYEEDDGWGGYDTYVDMEATILTWLALVPYRDQENVIETIEGIKNYVKSEIDEDMLICGSVSDTSLTIQALIADGDSVNLEGFTKTDKSGNQLTILDGLLTCKRASFFASSPTSSSASFDSTEYAICALADIRDGKSMYQTLRYVESTDPTRLVIRDVDVEIIEGDRLEFNADIYDKNGVNITDAEIEWSVNKVDLASFDKNILQTIVAGEIIVTAKVKGFDVKSTLALTVKSGFTEEILKKKALDELEFFKRVYIDANKRYEFLAPAAARSIGMDVAQIQEHLYTYSRMSNLITVTKQMIALTGAGLDPRDYEYVKYGKTYKVNLVDLMNVQQFKVGKYEGQFAFNSNDFDNAMYQSLAIIAMDMSDADYDKENAVKALTKLMDRDEYKDCVEEVSWAMIALSNHKEVDGVHQVLDKLKTELKKVQNEYAGYDIQDGQHKNSPIGTGLVVQALIAYGENPLTDKQWIVNRKTMLDCILMTKHDDVDVNKAGYYQYDGFEMLNYKAIYHAFAAVADMYNGKSMFTEMALDYQGTVENQTASSLKLQGTFHNQDKITMYSGESKDLLAYVLNSEGAILDKKSVIWSTESVHIQLSEDGHIKALTPSEGIVLKASYKEDGLNVIEQSFTIDVLTHDVKKLVLDNKFHGLHVGSTGELKVTALDGFDEVVSLNGIRYEIEDDSIATINNTSGVITGLKAGTTTITAVYEDLVNNTTLRSETLDFHVYDKKAVTVTISVYGDNPNTENDVLYMEKEITVENSDLGVYGNGFTQINSSPVTMNALIKLLELNKENCKDASVLGLTSDLSRLNSIKGLGLVDGYPNSGWMYFINDEYVSRSINSSELSDGDRIRVFHVLSDDESYYTKWKTEQNTVMTNEEIVMTLVALKKVPGTYTYVEEAIEGATLLVNGKELQVDGKTVVTDNAGRVNFSIDEVSTNVISAVIKEKTYTPPSRVIKVESKSLSNGLVIDYDDESKLKPGTESRFEIMTKNISSSEEALNYRFELYKGGQMFKSLLSTIKFDDLSNNMTGVGITLPNSDDLTLKIYLEDDKRNKQLIKTIEID